MSDNKNNGRVVLIAMDKSQNSRYTFEWYLKNLRKGDDTLVIVNSVNRQDVPLIPSYYFVPYAFDTDMQRSMIDYEAMESKERLEVFANILSCNKIKGTVKTIHASNAGKGIIHMASEITANLIVMGSNKHNSFRRKICGAVSDYVMHRSRIPVIVCRNKDSCCQRRRKSSH